MSLKNKEVNRPLVVVAAAAEDLDDFELLVADVARALELVPAPELAAREEVREKTIGKLLTMASSVSGPLLVLPPRRHAGAVPDRAGKARQAATRMRRVLIPSDASEEVTAATRALYRRFTRAGVRVTMLHVMTDDNMPRMWEGAGHHAAAWFDELRQKHGAGLDVLKVVSGEPGYELRVRPDAADLVVLFWRHDSRAGHAAVIRSLLVRGIEVPQLLVALEWMKGHASASHVPEASVGSG
jgi:hypothetical protein